MNYNNENDIINSSINGEEVYENNNIVDVENNNNNNDNIINNEDLYIITDDTNNQYIRNNNNIIINNNSSNNGSNNNHINSNNRINKGSSSSSIDSNEITDVTPIIKPINGDYEEDEVPISQKESNSKKARRHIIGSLLVLAVVSLWVASSVITQIIFITESYDKPFFLTYFGTSIFSFYLGGYFINWRKWTSIPFKTKEVDHDHEDDDENNSNKSVSPTTPIIIKDTNLETGIKKTNATISTTTNYKFTLKQILRISLILAPFWFFANYTYNLSLDRTSVSTNTILSTLSGIFSLFLSVFFKVDKFTIEKLIATLLTLTGVILVSYSDFDKTSNGTDTVVGDILAIAGAFLYGLYSVLVKKLIGSEENLPMPMMFGYLGLFNFIFLWPVFFILNLTSWEVFELPSSRVFVYLIFNGIFGSFISDLLDSYSVVMTSPVVNSIGLSLSIPFAMISDFVRTGKKFTLMYLFGSCLVVFGFLLINLASSIFENKLKSIEGKLFSRVKNLLNIKKND
ncbi:hypothetical protein RB653_002397 [Dictyostelium firmibasis]|uniref:EamA domain-containing protein n=1 Tax=Dictyostelium firmibasis TaxID=79012 RepID=A0AAN7YQ13_9MYCE